VDTLKQNLGPVVGAVAVVGVGLWVLAPGALVAVVPLLFVLACPLGMVLMMKTMGGMGGQQRAEGEPSTTEPAASKERELAELRAELEELKGDRPGEGEGRRTL
jgi:hypothetical protein